LNHSTSESSSFHLSLAVQSLQKIYQRDQQSSDHLDKAHERLDSCNSPVMEDSNDDVPTRGKQSQTKQHLDAAKQKRTIEEVLR
jgi:hypothetical protein